MSRVPVIIPFYREQQKLERCLAHLRAQTHADIEVFVRDNSEDNVYFTAAINEGLKKFCYDPAISYVVILNQDAYLAADAIGILSGLLDRNRHSGIPCPLQLTEGGAVSWGGSLRGFPSGSGESTNWPLELVKLKDAIYFSRKWLSGDLYRSLAFEGPALTAVGVRHDIDKLEKAAAKLEKMRIIPTGPH
jgi:GT2 family glycosyltransferase